MGRPHPEIEWGIPANVVCAKSKTAKEAAAKLSDYQGPLTLLDAVRAGQLDAVEAVVMIQRWYQGGGVGRGEALRWCAEIEAVVKKWALEEERQAGNAPASLLETSQEPPEEAPEVSQAPPPPPETPSSVGE